jgi:zinc protease
MTKQFLLSSALILALAACTASDTDGTLESASSNASSASEKAAVVDGFRLVEEVKASADETNIPFRKFVLENGLTVVLHQDKSDPIAHVDVTYHVGSGREDIGKSGFAHFFEHMLFQGSQNVADEAHFKIITEAGGTLNGTTNSDRTNYFQTVPNNQLEKMLWLEADRMGYLLDAVTPEKFEVQRETVKNERGQRVDNQPYGLLGERVGEAMFPEGHPYSWSVIGYLEDLDRATLNDLKKFFLKWYGPNNAVLTIGGDLDEVETLEWVKKYFGPIPKGADVSDPVYEPVTLDADRYISLEDNVSLPLIYMQWPTVKVNHPDEAPLDVLQSIMGGGKTSLLYKNLEKTGKSVNAGANHSCRELSCEFAVFALPNPAKGASLADLEADIRASFLEFEDRGVTDDDLERVKSSIISGMIYGLESVSGKVSQLAYYETFRDTPNGMGDDIARYQNVKKADVLRVYNKYIKDKPSVIMSIVPKGKPEMIAAADTWDRYTRNIPADSGSDDFEWTAPVDNFDRSIVPPSGPNPTIKVPDVANGVLGNGIRVMAAQNTEVPTTTINIRMKVGQTHESLEKLGLAVNTAQYLNDAATLQSTAEDLSNRLSKLGSFVSFSAGDNFTTLSIRTLTANLDETLEIAKEKLLEPKFAEDEFARLKAQTLEGIKQSKKQAGSVAWELYNRKLYGDDNAFAWAGSGTLNSVEQLKLSDFETFYKDHYSPKIATITAVSDLNKTKLMKALKTLDDWSGPEVRSVKDSAYPELQAGTIYFVHKDKAAQSEIRIGKRSLPYDATGEYQRATMMNYALGGAFNSRINLNLREDKGYSYGARSFFNGQETRGSYTALAAVKKDTTAASITEFIKEIDGYRTGGVTEDELAFTKNAIGQRDARAYETPRQKLGLLNRMMQYNLSTDFVEEQNRILANMTKADMDALAKKHLTTDDMIMVVVGDKDVVWDNINALGYKVVEIDADGNSVQ